MAGKTRITSSSKKAQTPKEKKKALSYKEKLGQGNFKNPENTNALCWGWFLVEQLAKSNSKATIDSYNRFYQKYIAYLMNTFNMDKEEAENAPVEWLSGDATQLSFIAYLKVSGAKSQQTVNHYLRSMSRAAFREFLHGTFSSGGARRFRRPSWAYQHAARRNRAYP